ncbi:MAG TPA: hypothetical protein PKH69_08345 [Thiobacillaceae bacterium]|nr:hypothetical protein [Thiobacillaceae bacterium]HNU63891.1 hypothetical protein [Thiobacillaceae bacterium]
MKREPQAATNILPVRDAGNSLFFNKLDYPLNTIAQAWNSHPRAFARSWWNPQSERQVASAEHRPASRPGAD